MSARDEFWQKHQPPRMQAELNLDWKKTTTSIWVCVAVIQRERQTKQSSGKHVWKLETVCIFSRLTTKKKGCVWFQISWNSKGLFHRLSLNTAIFTMHRDFCAKAAKENRKYWRKIRCAYISADQGISSRPKIPLIKRMTQFGTLDLIFTTWNICMWKL